MASRSHVNALRVLPEIQTEWLPDRAICAVKLHTRLVALLLQKLELPHLEELRRREVRVEARCSKTWQVAASGGLYQRVVLECPLWQRIWPGNEDPKMVSVFVLTTREIRILEELEIHVSAALMHLGHASSHLHEVGKLFSSDLRQREAALSDREVKDDGNEEAISEVESEVEPDTPDTGGGLAARFAQCLDNLSKVLWAFHVHVQLSHAAFQGDVPLLAVWSLRLLGLAEPWPLRRLHDFTLSVLELVLSEGQEMHAESKHLLQEASSVYLAVPVIPRMQGRMRSCLRGLRSLLPQLASELRRLEEAESSDFDAGAGFDRFLERDSWHQIFQKSFRKAVVGRVDRSCTQNVRHLAGVQALCEAPLARTPWPESQRLLEVLASVPEGTRFRLLDEEEPQRQSDPMPGASEESLAFLCSGVCSKPD